MAKNPLLERKFQEGYAKGYKAGKDAGISAASDFFIEKFSRLQESYGIGPKTLDKFRNAFGPEYFKESK